MPGPRRMPAVAAAALLIATAGCGAAETVATDEDGPSAGPGETSTSADPSGTTRRSNATPAPSPDPPSTTGGQTATTPNSDPTGTGAPPLTDKPVVPSPADLKTARSRPVEDPYYPETSNPEVDALHYDLALAWDGFRLTGRATVTFRAARPTSSVRLDLSRSLKVSAVELDDEPVDYSQAGDGLEMATGRLNSASTHTLTVDYAGSPASTPAPSRRPDMAEGLGWSVDSDGSVHTFQEPYGAFTWYPVNDHPSDKALYDAAISTPGDDVAVFNGQLVSTEQTGQGTVSRWHVDEPVASYLTTIAIGPYTEHVSTTPSGMRISYWLLRRDEPLLRDLQDAGSAAFEWLVRRAGPYPFSTLGVVVVGGSSAMETQTMVTMSRGVADERATLLHEMAHQWYGDTVTPLDWQGVWLSEGWAMYMQQWYEVDKGLRLFAGGIDSWRRYDQAARAKSGPPGDYDPESFADLNVYLGPALMLDQIRQRVGSAAFNRLVKAWPAEHENQNVDRQTFTRWLNHQTGENFRPLLRKWLDSAKTPR